MMVFQTASKVFLCDSRESREAEQKILLCFWQLSGQGSQPVGRVCQRYPAGLILFPAYFSFDMEVDAGPGLLFDTMATVFNSMSNGRV